jgi:hypothetical protein
MIELFKELEIKVDLAGFENLKLDLQAKVSPPWSYYGDRVFTLKKLVSFRCSRGSNPDAILSLAWQNGKAWISNIVPAEIGQFSKAEYNAVLDDFYTRYIKPTAENLQLKLTLTNSHRDLDEWVGADAQRQLEVFSAMSPKASSSHPMDRQRWLDFVISAHKHTKTEQLPTEVLEIWLINEGWPEEVAQKLAADYIDSVELLKRYALAS